MRLARSVIVASLTVATAGAGLAIAAAPASAAAATRYVATTGDDGKGNNCLTRTTPCKTISNAVSQAVAGDTVSIASGTYAETVPVDKQLTLAGDASGGTVITGDSEGGAPSVIVVGTASPTPARCRPSRCATSTSPATPADWAWSRCSRRSGSSTPTSTATVSAGSQRCCRP